MTHPLFCYVVVHVYMWLSMYIGNGTDGSHSEITDPPQLKTISYRSTGWIFISMYQGFYPSWLSGNHSTSSHHLFSV